MNNTTINSTLTDQTVAADMLLAAKCSVKDLSIAITESASPQVRSFLKQELDSAVSFHESMYTYMQSKGWYDAYNINKQIQNDIQNATNALNL
jgi:similar to spore coat protein